MSGPNPSSSETNLPNAPETYISALEAAGMIGATVGTVRRWALAGMTSYGHALTARRDGKRWLIPESEARTTAQHKRTLYELPPLQAHPPIRPMPPDRHAAFIAVYKRVIAKRRATSHRPKT